MGNRERERKSITREMKGLIKLFDEANSYMSKNSAQFLDVALRKS